MSTKFIYPNVEPTLGADFANSKRIPPEFQFTRASTGTYIGSDGLIKSARAGEPRFDCDPLTGNVKGLLVEAARTNLITNSNTLFSNRNTAPQSLGNIGGTISYANNATLAPDGTNTAAIIYRGGTGYMVTNTFFSYTGFRSFSAYLKVMDGTPSIGIWKGAGGDFNLNFNTITKQFTGGSSTLVSYGYKEFSTGWFWLWMVMNYSGNWEVGVLGAAQRTSTDVGVWGVQFENGSNPTSLIPTSGSSVTRVADILTVPTSIFLNTSKSSIVVESETTINDSPVISLNDGTTFNETKLIVYPTAGVSKLVTNDIVRSGLVLNLDAGNPASYSGSETTWTDLSGNGNNGTLVNGVGYSSSNLGSLVFDGVNDGVQLPHNSYWILTPTSSFSLCSWFYAEPTIQNNSMIFSHQNCNNPAIQIIVNGTTSVPSLQGRYASNDFVTYTANVTGQWNYVVYTFDGAGNMKLYLNSSLVATLVSTGTWSAYSSGYSEVWLGRRASCGGTNELIGKIASFSYYKDRALTASEIQQNFNATKSRYI